VFVLTALDFMTSLEAGQPDAEVFLAPATLACEQQHYDEAFTLLLKT